MKTHYNFPPLYENDSKQSLKNIVGAEITCKNLREKNVLGIKSKSYQRPKLNVVNCSTSLLAFRCCSQNGFRPLSLSPLLENLRKNNTITVFG